MQKKWIENSNLPDSPGVYLFKDAERKILYIGRATSLKDRVRSYFANDLIHTRGPLLVDMVTKADKVDFQETDSVLEAIILESNLIKDHQPYYNTQEKDDKSYNFVVITDEEFPRVIIVRERNLKQLKSEDLGYEIRYKFGPYTQNSLLKEALRIVRKIFPFRDEKSSIPHNEKFYRSIGLSPKIDSVDSKREYQRTIRNIVLFFQGKKNQLIRTLEKEMKEYAQNQEFEKAEKVKHTLYSLTHIQDVSLIKKENETTRTGFRIEAYDIAHLSGKNNVGVMTVVIDGEPEKSAYRKFKISKETNDDVAALKEVLTRRFGHAEWGIPDLIVIDGGMGQKNAAESIVKQVPVVSVVKNDAHKADHLLGDEDLVRTHMKSIVLANAESHRFAIAYHKNLRRRRFLMI